MATNAAMSRPLSAFPRVVLGADGAVCASGGAALLVAATPIDSILGLNAPLGLRVVGALLAPYGLWLAWTAPRLPEARLRALLRAIAIGNGAWVLASLAVLLRGVPTLSAAGRWAVAAQAMIVALFASAQFRALRRMRAA